MNRTKYNPMMYPKPDRDEYCYLHSQGEFSVFADIAHEKKLERIRKFIKYTPDFMKKVILKRPPAMIDSMLRSF